MTEKRSPARELLAHFRENGLDAHGAVIRADDVRAVLGIDMPEVATREEFQSLAMLELAGIDYVRKILLREGKYLAQSKGDYRILLPSENAAQVASYMQSADKKLKRALVLTKNTPAQAESMREAEQVQARIHIKRESIRDQKTFGRLGPADVMPTPSLTSRMPLEIGAAH